ncbi:hypothetical protein K491DRAFT_29966 [Lophiostoma macrostomum CBS 122681]|uniref:BTB domain-containing protein n=1 Tax=Lophiostoma macrostomum CBS 122681 TaxID=1314788 RepID=A0A6A6T0G8_9PLEO|nr:hypothetical protein K491DRAFT_29966 [Lophiostoma macrostomum CBS 122681]
MALKFEFFRRKVKAKPVGVQRRLTKRNKKENSKSPSDSDVARFLETNKPAATAPIPEPQGEWVALPPEVPRDPLGAVVPTRTIAVQELGSGIPRWSSSPALVKNSEFGSTPLDWPDERYSGSFSSGVVVTPSRRATPGLQILSPTSPAPEVSASPTTFVGEASHLAASPGQGAGQDLLSPPPNAVELPAHDTASSSSAESVTVVPDEHPVSVYPHAQALHELSQSLQDLRARDTPQQGCVRLQRSCAPIISTTPNTTDIRRIAPWVSEFEAVDKVIDQANFRSTIAPPNLDQVPNNEILSSPNISPESRNNTTTGSSSSSSPGSDSSANDAPLTDITFLVGAQDPTSRYLTPQYFQLPVEFLQHSKLLTKYQGCAHKHGSRSPPTIRLPDVDPQAFGLWCSYIAGGKPDAEDAITKGIFVQSTFTKAKWRWVALWPLINAHMLAFTLGDDGFGDYILSLLREKVVKRQSASVETINHVFGAVDVSEDLRRFLAEEAIDGGVKNFTPEMIARYPSAFVGMALERTVEILETILNKGKREVEGESRVGVGALRKMKNEMTRAVSTRESAEKRRAVGEEGVKIVDWAEKTAYKMDEVTAGLDKKSGATERSESTEETSQNVAARAWRNRMTAVVEGEVIVGDRPASSSTQVQMQDDLAEHSQAAQVSRPVTPLEPPLDAFQVEELDCHEKDFDDRQEPWWAMMPGGYPESTVGGE